MQSFCTSCGSPLSPEEPACSQCQPAVEPAPEPSRMAEWGVWRAGLGLMVLVPTAALIASVALVIPLAVAAVVSATALGILQVALVWFLGIRTWPVPWELLRFVRPVTPRLVTAVLTVGTILGSLGFAQLYTMAAMALGWDFLEPPELPGDLLLPGGWVAVSFLALAVWTPVAEEVFFRGFVLRGLVNRWGPAPALIVSAAVFSALHLAPALLIPVFVTGLLLGFLYLRTGSIWPCIAVHACQNLIAVASTWLGL